MEQHQNIEKFLSEPIFLETLESRETIFLKFIFHRDSYHVFSDPNNHNNLGNYFNGRKIKLIINDRESKQRISLIDLETGDIINMSQAIFTEHKLKEFIEKASKARQIPIMICGINPNGLKPEVAPNHHHQSNTPIKIRGFDYIGKE